MVKKELYGDFLNKATPHEEQIRKLELRVKSLEDTVDLLKGFMDVKLPPNIGHDWGDDNGL